MFIRVKNIRKKGKNTIYQYAYAVENVWRKRRKEAKQMVKKYLGRVHKLDKKENNEFFEYYSITDTNQYTKKSNKNKIITDLVKLELVNHGFRGDGKVLTNGVLTFDLVDNKFIGGNKVLAINEGFLCKETVRRLISGKFEGTEKEVGYKLAKAFVEAGLKVPEELFIGMFEKIVIH
tara:strand:- start:184 stop:714 length:531 start_codon:yes stop_codon:yes gene_type:complete